MDVKPKDFTAVVKFGSGLHSRASEDDIDASECADGRNFDLDPKDRQFRNRKPFDLIGTVPNEEPIQGGACLLETDGTISVLVQAGDTVYEWNGATTFTSRGTVSSSAKLRGRLEYNWQLDDKVIITDLALAQPVMEWDGTTLQNVTFTTEDGSTAFGEFRARYCKVSNERVIFANVYNNGTAFPHLIVGSEIGNFEIITVANRPSSSLSEGDPFFLIQPDYSYINGLVGAFGLTVTSSKIGSFYKLSGESAKDFAFTELYPRSGASGDESVTYVGNDVIYGRQGRVESLVSTDKFGDVDTDDLSLFLDIPNYDNWTIVYNSRNQRVYCYPFNKSQLLVYHKSLAGQFSPWSKWLTTHDMSFNPTFIMNMLDPSDGLEYVFMGDSAGNFYRLEGVGESGDGGTDDIIAERLSGLIEVPEDFQAWSVEGWITYRTGDPIVVSISILYSGKSIFDETINITIPETINSAIYGGGYYYSDGNYYGSFSGRLKRQPFSVPGKGNSMQVRITVQGSEDFEIKEVGIRFNSARP